MIFQVEKKEGERIFREQTLQVNYLFTSLWILSFGQKAWVNGRVLLLFALS